MDAMVRVVAHLGKGCFLSTEVRGRTEVGRAKKMFLHHSIVRNITVQYLVSYKAVPGYSPEDRALFLPQWSQGGTIWPEVADRKKIVLYWKNGGTYERIIESNSAPGADQFIDSCVEEHAQPGPHSLLPALSQIIVQEWTAQGWGLPTIVWPSN